MTNEEIYDAEIAPALRKISDRCKELEMPMIAQVEFDHGYTGRLEFTPGDAKRPSAKQLLVHYAARCNGNVDMLLLAVMRDARVYGHSSFCLLKLGCNNLESQCPETNQQPASEIRG